MRHHAQDRVADAFGLRGQLKHVNLVELAMADDLVGSLLRNQAEPTLHLGQLRFDVEVLLRLKVLRNLDMKDLFLCNQNWHAYRGEM